MAPFSQIGFCLILIVCLSLPSSLCTSTFISDGIFGSPVLSERRLLQAKKPCPVNFEFQNDTIITSKCKGPRYPRDLCCSSFKEFACPHADELNDLSNDCATTMFSYINLYGKYPPGVFASECREGKNGLECPAPPPGSAQSEIADNSNRGGRIVYGLLPVIMFAAATVTAICVKLIRSHIGSSKPMWGCI